MIYALIYSPVFSRFFEWFLFTEARPLSQKYTRAITRANTDRLHSTTKRSVAHNCPNKYAVPFEPPEYPNSQTRAASAARTRAAPGLPPRRAASTSTHTLGIFKSCVPGMCQLQPRLQAGCRATCVAGESRRVHQLKSSERSHHDGTHLERCTPGLRSLGRYVSDCRELGSRAGRRLHLNRCARQDLLVCRCGRLHGLLLELGGVRHLRHLLRCSTGARRSGASGQGVSLHLE
jgi:hypothetical protein